MALIPRHIGIGNQSTMHQHDEASGAVVAGAVMYMKSDGKLAPCTSSGHVPYALCFQNVVGDMAGLPANFKFPNQEGSSDASLGDPVLVYKDGGVYHTDYYNITGSGIAAGALLYCQTDDTANDGKLVDDDGSSVDVALDDAGAPKPCARVLDPLTAAEVTAGKQLLIDLLL